MSTGFTSRPAVMQHAIKLACQGRGYVEPNPCVGAVLISGDGHILAEGYHRYFGGPHAEVEVLNQVAHVPPDATLFVTLEPCNHFGKTPPCTELIIRKGVRHVVIGCIDPAPHVAGAGIKRLQSAGIHVEVGCHETAAQELIAPFNTLQLKHRPYIHAKWAMTLDGKIATASGHSKWITNADSRAYAHKLRGEMDAILTGIGTVLADDPLLTARPPLGEKSPRIPLRIVLDRQARLPLDSQLASTAREIPVMLVVSANADQTRCQKLSQLGIEVIQIEPTLSPTAELGQLMSLLAQRNKTHLLIEAGSEILGSFFDAKLIDELHMFLAPKLVGGVAAKSPLGGNGLTKIPELANCKIMEQREFAGDYYFRGRLLTE